MADFPKTIDEVQRDNLKTFQSQREAAEFDARMEKHFQSHPELKSGRDFRMNTMRYQIASYKVADTFDQTFAGAPDSPDWWDKNFCDKCGRRKTMCICIRSES